MAKPIKVLMVTSRDDAHAQAVAAHLEPMHAHVDYFKYDEFIRYCSLAIRLGTGKRVCVLERADEKLDLHSYTSIWYRRPGPLAAGKFPEPWISLMVEREASSTLDGMWRLLPVVWMNFPAHDTAATSKLWQLKLASDVGLSIPETLVTNKPALVRKFFKDCEGEVIYKLISDQTCFAIPRSETPAGIATLPLRAEDLSFIDQVSHAPHLFQRYIKKIQELRVTIVGKQLFCMSIDSQSGRAKIDWRNDYSVEMKPFELPDRIKSKCFELMRHLGLNYGALDFIQTDGDEYVFLEINPGGQYLWIEQRTPLQISQQVAKLLAGESEPLVAPAVR